MKLPYKSFNIDFNWHNGRVAAADKFVSADTKKIVEWYKQMNVDNFWTFATTYNGYAWYDSKIAPKAVGLEGDFLSDTVRLGHEAGMEVFAYTCLGDNPYLISRDPSIARVDEDMFRMPLTDWYIDYFCSICDETIKHAPVDGIVIDWFRYPRNPRTVWVEQEKLLFKQLMGEKLPISDISQATLVEFERHSLAHAWQKIYNTIKVKHGKKIWTNQPFDFVNDPIWNGHILMQQADYILNECPDFNHLEWIASQAGKDTMVVQNLCGWENHDLSAVDTIDANRFGLFGFAAASDITCMPEKTVSPVNYANIEIIRKIFTKK